MNENHIRITDGNDRTADIISLNSGNIHVVMYEASSDYHQNAWFATLEEAQLFSEKWVYKK